MRRLSKEQILLLHTQLIEEFGGTDGVRDYNLLDSALETRFNYLPVRSCIRLFRRKQRDWVMG